MKRRVGKRPVIALLGAALLGAALRVAAAGPAAATAPAATTAIRVSHAWIRVLPGNLPAAGYARLENRGDESVALVGARSEGYRRIVLHESLMSGGMAAMKRVSHLTIPAHGRAALSPGGYHLMLMDATHPVKPGDAVAITLVFAGGSTQTITFLAMPANAGTGSGGAQAPAASRTSSPRN